MESNTYHHFRVFRVYRFLFWVLQGMVDGLLVACGNAQEGQADGSDLALAQGMEALNELRSMGWDEQVNATYPFACFLFA